MANFTGQLTKSVDIKNAFKTAVPDLTNWLPVWLKAGRDKQLIWLNSNKSPLLTITMLLYMYLRKFYAELDNDIDSGKITGDYQDFTIEVTDV